LDERRRILELFKERKKNRRKERKSVTSTTGGGTGAVSSSLGDGMDADTVAETATSSTCGTDDVSPNPTGPAVESSTNSSSSSSSSTNSSCSGRSGKENTNDPIQHQLQQQHRVQQQQQQQGEDLNGFTSLGGKVKGKVDSASIYDAVSTSKDGTAMPLETNTSVTLSKAKTKSKNKNNKVKRPLSTNSNGVMDNHDDHKSVRENSIGEETGLSSSPPSTHSEFLNNPLLQPCSSSSGNNNNNSNNRSEPLPSLTSIAPPGFHNISMNTLTLEDSGESDIATGMAQDMNGEYASGFHPPAHPTMSTTQDLYIVIPPVDRPIYSTGSNFPLSCRPSLAIPAAKAFVDLYYRLLTTGHYSELSRYYTPNAQKSISVGGAHSVVATRPEIMLQLQSLSQSIFIVRGVVSQDTQDGRGAHILVTGMVQTGEVLTQFAHSVGLVAVPQQYGLFSFQIHNDALALMATGGSGGGEEEGVVARDCPDHVRGGGVAGEQGIQQHGDGQERWNRDMSTSTNGFSKSVVQDKCGVSSQNGWHQ